MFTDGVIHYSDSTQGMPLKWRLRIVYCCIAVLVILPLWYANQGFDICDEGYYLQGYMRNQPIFFQYTGFHFFVKLLPFSDNLLAARLYKLVMIMLAACVLGYSLKRKIFIDDPAALVLGYSLLGGLLIYMHGPSTISYNSLSLVFMLLLVALYMEFRMATNFLATFSIWTILLFAIILGCLAFNKITSAALMAVFISVDQFIYRRKYLLSYFGLIGVIAIISLITLALLFWLAYGSHLQFIYHCSGLANNPFSERHVNAGFMIRQLVWTPFTQSKTYVVFTVLYLLVYVFFSRTVGRNSVTAQLIFAGIFIASLIKYRAFYFSQPSAEGFYALVFFILVVIFFAAIAGKSTYKIDKHFVCLLFAVPFIGFWGSDNPPMLGVIHYTGFTLLLVYYLNHFLQLRFLHFIPVLITAFTIWNFLWNPFFNPPVFEYNKYVKVHGVETKVSDYTFEAQDNFLQILPHISKDEPIIPIAVPNGLMYINELPSYLTLYYNSPNFTTGYINLLGMTSLPERFQILFCKTDTSSEVAEAYAGFKTHLARLNYRIELLAETAQYAAYRASKATK